MKSLIVISLLVAMLVQTFSTVLVMVDFQANKAYIVEFLCINRDKLELQCEGLCYLQDKLKKQEQSEKQADRQSQQQEYHIYLICQDLFHLKPSPLAITGTENSCYLTAPVHKVSLAVFHPPRFQV